MKWLVALTTLCCGPALLAQNHELGLTLGHLVGTDRGVRGESLDLGGGTALQANYGYRLFLTRHFSYTGEVHFLANGQRPVESTNPAATRDLATIFVTPGLRVKFHPASRRFSPYVVGGGGYALFEQSYYRVDGARAVVPRFTHRGALMFGGGADIPVKRWIGIRLEARDFYTGNPALNSALASSGQHNVVLGGGFVLHWGSRE
jgi:hypothetical protein